MLWHDWGKLTTLLGIGHLIILPCSCSVMNMILWHYYYYYFILYHFRLWHDGAHLAWILWRWVDANSSVFSFCYFCWHITTLLFSMTCLLPQGGMCPHCHFPFLSPLSLFFLCNTLLMSVILISCSFVIISFCSFIIAVMFSSMHTKLLVTILSSSKIYASLVSTFCVGIWSFCMPLIATFLSLHLRFVHATDCYIFVIIFEVCACHWLLHFCHHEIYVGERKSGLHLGFDMYVEKKLG